MVVLGGFGQSSHVTQNGTDFEKSLTEGPPEVLCQDLKFVWREKGSFQWAIRREITENAQTLIWVVHFNWAYKSTGNFGNQTGPYLSKCYY
jgi:hypothetical protein